MKKYTIVAYADPEYGLKKQETVVMVENHDAAMNKAWRMFPEYHEVGVYEIGQR